MIVISFQDGLYFNHAKQTSVGLMKGGNKMKKSSFIALVMGTIGGVLFALGMCMALVEQWNTFAQGVAFGAAGLIVGAATLVAWYRMENKQLPRLSGRNLLRAAYIAAAVLLLGVGMCLCLVWQRFVWGTLIGLAGILMLLGLIPMILGLK